jgi:hypothetical protein
VDGLLARLGSLYFGIKTNVLIQENPAGKARVLWARGTPYPSLEVYHYSDSTPEGKLLYYYDATKEGTGAQNLAQEDEVLTDRQPVP